MQFLKIREVAYGSLSQLRRKLLHRRVAEILGFFGAVISLLFSQSGQLFARFDPNGRELTGVINQIAQMDQPWSPLAWGSFKRPAARKPAARAAKSRDRKRKLMSLPPTPPRMG